MNWQYYRNPDHKMWTGRNDNDYPERFHQVIKCNNLPQLTANNKTNNNSPPHPTPAIALLGFASDEGVIRNQGRAGAKDGPLAIRQALANLSLPQSNQGNKNLHNFTISDFGDICCINGKLEAAQQELAQAVSTLRSNNYFPIVLGGGHETAWGNFQGLRHGIEPAVPLSIINFDAHLDMRPLLANGWGTSGTPFLQAWQYCQEQQLPFRYTCIGLQAAANTASLFATAHQAKVTQVFADEIIQSSGAAILQAIAADIEQQVPIYLTFCLDVLASAEAPGVSAPQPFGLPVHLVKPALAKLMREGNVVGFDIVELAPNLDNQRQTAMTAAAIVREVVCNYI